MTQSWHDLIETALLALGLLALLYATLLNAGVVNQKDVNLNPAFARKKILVASQKEI